MNSVAIVMIFTLICFGCWLVFRKVKTQPLTSAPGDPGIYEMTGLKSFPEVPGHQSQAGEISEPVVLVDDDFLIRMGWETKAEQAEIEFEAFESAEILLERVEKLPKSTSFYLDVDLGDGMSGTELSGKLKALGFHRIWLATGYVDQDFNSLGILGVVSKTPPF